MLINKGDDVEEEDRYSVAVMDNPIYDVDPEERAGTVAYYRSGQDDDDDTEEVVKVCAYFPPSARACIRGCLSASMVAFLLVIVHR